MNYVTRSNTKRNAVSSSRTGQTQGGTATMKRYRLVGDHNEIVASRPQQIFNTILASNGHNEFVVLFVNGCGPSMQAMHYIKRLGKPHQFFEISQFRQAMFALLCQNKAATNFNCSQTTVPVVFYNGQFVGGLTELLKLKIS